jgi:DNA polymerase IIIc chi subunit
MTPISFYQVAESTPAAIDATLPGLLQKAYGSGQNILILAPTAERAQRLEEGLWGGLGALEPESFLPHAIIGKGNAEAQPILIANTEEYTEFAEYAAQRLPLVLAGAEAPLPSLLAMQPTRLFYMFSAAPHDTARARELYKIYKTQGHPLKYYAQEDGRWVEKG